MKIGAAAEPTVDVSTPGGAKGKLNKSDRKQKTPVNKPLPVVKPKPAVVTKNKFDVLDDDDGSKTGPKTGPGH